MYLLISCTISWLCLLGAFITTWTALPAPRSTSDVAVIMIVGAAALLFSRHGLTSVLTLLIRLLPSGRLRTVVIRSVLRVVPTLLRSSVLAAVSASVAVHAGHASPLPSDGLTGATGAEQVATAPSSARAEPAPDPGWPTAVPDDPAPDPGWPSVPPVEESTPPPDHGPSPEHDSPSDHATAPETDGSSPEADDSSSEAADSSPETDDSSPGADDSAEDGPGSPGPGHDDETVHIVGAGESLWSIAASRSSPDANTQDTVEQIYSANRDVIGANPNLIMPGQRLEIQP